MMLCVCVCVEGDGRWDSKLRIKSFIFFLYLLFSYFFFNFFYIYFFLRGGCLSFFFPSYTEQLHMYVCISVSMYILTLSIKPRIISPHLLNSFSAKFFCKRLTPLHIIHELHLHIIHSSAIRKKLKKKKRAEKKLSFIYCFVCAPLTLTKQNIEYPVMYHMCEMMLVMIIISCWRNRLPHL